MKVVANDKTYELTPFLCRKNKGFAFHINVTNICNCKCQYCCNDKTDPGKLNLTDLEKIIESSKEDIERFSINGGEPLLVPDELEALLKLLEKYKKPIKIGTNGYHIEERIDLLNSYPVRDIQFSCHHYDSKKNKEIFKADTISFAKLKDVVDKLKPSIIINCLLIRGYIDNEKEVVNFLEECSKVGIRSVSFIGMMKINEFCENNYVDYKEITKKLPIDFLKTMERTDGKRCHCESFAYAAKNGNCISVLFRHIEECYNANKSVIFDASGLDHF